MSLCVPCENLCALCGKKRRPKSLPENFALLVQDLAGFAPDAMLNRGAFFPKQDEKLFPYPTKNAFSDEITWLLWRLKRSCPPP